MNKWHRRIWLAVSVIFWLCIWQLGAMWVDQEILLVSPLRAIQALWEMMLTEDFYIAIAGSLSRIAIGFGAALIAGVMLAAVARFVMPVRMLLAPVMSAIKATPVASFVILALIWISSKNLSVVMSFLIVLPVVYSNFLDGLDRADVKLIEMAKVFRMPFARQIRAIYWPAAFPYLLTSVRLSLGMCWKAGIAAEVIAQPRNSIGSALQRAKVFFSTPELFAWTLAIIIISVALEKLMMVLIRLMSRRLYDRNS
ncbi:MAG: ABC transporter permease subunit [Clostridia bacterium]|nr:ABC transporter permease subunit [Clostridia bacterium]